jgi:hypothetical protein
MDALFAEWNAERGTPDVTVWAHQELGRAFGDHDALHRDEEAMYACASSTRDYH